jgi:hypothetical protein
MENLNGFDFQAMHYDEHGNAQSGVEEFAQHVKKEKVTDAIFLCHGFRNDENAARTLYGNFLKSFSANASLPAVAEQLSSRKFAVAGVFWPSMIFRENFDVQGSALSADIAPSASARLQAMKSGLDGSGQAIIDQMTDLLSNDVSGGDTQLKLSGLLINLAQSLPVEAENECRTAFAKAKPDVLRDSLLAGDSIQVVAAGAGPGGSMGIPTLGPGPGAVGQAQSFFGPVVGFVAKFLNLTTFLLMFHRCGDIGTNGISQAVRRVRSLSSSVRVHLVGHSLGGRSITACAKQLVMNEPNLQVDSMMMLEAAYSHFGLSPAGAGLVPHPRGFFRDVVEKNAVKTPILATYSDRDSVVGFAYTSMAAVSLNRAQAFGDEHSPFGGIGRNGVLDTTDATKEDLHVPNDAYTFSGSKIRNLNGSKIVNGKPLIDSHGDVTNPAVTWAFASLVAIT